MRTSIPFSCFFLIGILGTIAVPDIRAQTSQTRIPKEAESRLRAIYEREEFRAKTPEAELDKGGPGASGRRPRRRPRRRSRGGRGRVRDGGAEGAHG